MPNIVIRFFLDCYRHLTALVARSAAERRLQAPATATHGARSLLWLVLASLLIGLQLEAGRAAPLPFQSNSTNPTATPTPTITPTWTPSFTPGAVTDTPMPTPTATPLPAATPPTPTPTLPGPTAFVTATLTATLPALTDTPTPASPDTPPPPTEVMTPTALPALLPATLLPAVVAPPLPRPPATDGLVQPATPTPPVASAGEAGLFAQTLIQALSFVWLGCGILVILGLGSGLFFLLRRGPAE